MGNFEYAAARVPIDEPIVAAHRETWRRIADAGTWWTGAERVAIAAEVRRAASCALCRERKAALSPAVVAVEHEANDALSAAAVDAVQRNLTEAMHHSKNWLENQVAPGF